MTRRLTTLSVAATLLAATFTAGTAAAHDTPAKAARTYTVICSFRDPYGTPVGFQTYGPYTTRASAVRKAAAENATFQRTIGYKPCAVR